MITAVEIHGKDANDCPQLPPLVRKTSQNFAVNEVSADKEYLSAENVEAIASVGGSAYIAIKKNTTGGVGGLFEKMYHLYELDRDDYLGHYHKRSNVESSCSMVRAKFGDSVRSKTDVAMKNEALCKIVCHNICCLVQSMYELGIDPEFWMPQAPDPQVEETLQALAWL